MYGWCFAKTGFKKYYLIAEVPAIKEREKIFPILSQWSPKVNGYKFIKQLMG